MGEEQRAIEPERGLIANTRTMAVASLISRVTGFLRNSLLVAALGVHGVANAYNLANNFPNMVYELLLGGVLSSVLVPLLVHAQEDDADGGVAYTQRLMSIATAALGGLTLLAVACAPLLAAGFVDNSAQRSLTSIFATLLLPEIFFYGVGAMLMAVLNVRHSYGPGAWAPVLNNVVVIATVVTFWVLPGPHTLTPTLDDDRADPGARDRDHAGDRRTGTRAHPGAAQDRLPLAVALPGLSERDRPDARGRHARLLGARLRGGQPDRRDRRRQGRPRPRRVHRVHQRRPAAPDALRHPRRLVAHRA